MKKYFLMILCLLFFSCGGAGGGSAPPTSTITIQPSSFSVTDGNAALSVASETFVVQALDPKGQPLGDLPISFQFKFTTAPSFPVSCNPSLTAADIVTLDNGQQIYNTQATGETNADTGQYSINIKFLKGCGLNYAGTLEVFGDGIQTPTTATLSVTP
jgi:hypothetical protein